MNKLTFQSSKDYFQAEWPDVAIFRQNFGHFWEKMAIILSYFYHFLNIFWPFLIFSNIFGVFFTFWRFLTIFGYFWKCSSGHSEFAAEEEVLDWLIEMNVENHIELITRPMLEIMVEEIQYLSVYFCKYPMKLLM